jgi:hypothetical protein
LIRLLFSNFWQEGVARRPPPRFGLDGCAAVAADQAAEPDVEADLDRRAAAARAAGAHDDPRGQQLDLFAIEFFDGECVHLLLLRFLGWFVVVCGVQQSDPAWLI